MAKTKVMDGDIYICKCDVDKSQKDDEHIYYINVKCCMVNEQATDFMVTSRSTVFVTFTMLKTWFRQKILHDWEHIWA